MCYQGFLSWRWCYFGMQFKVMFCPLISNRPLYVVLKLLAAALCKLIVNYQREWCHWMKAGTRYSCVKFITDKDILGCNTGYWCLGSFPYHWIESGEQNAELRAKHHLSVYHNFTREEVISPGHLLELLTSHMIICFQHCYCHTTNNELVTRSSLYSTHK